VGFSLRQLRYFVAVAESGRFSAAARELFVAQSTLTSAVQEIELQLGHTVFERSVRGVELTDAGQALLPRARQILELVAEAENYTAAEAELGGTVRIGASYTVMGYFLPQHIQRLAARLPRVELEWREMDRAAIEEALLDGRLDLGLMLTSNLRSEGLDFAPLVRSARRLWVGASHPLARRSGLRLSDLREFPYAMLTVDEADASTRSYWPDSGNEILVATSSLEAIRSLVGSGSAITILSDMVYRPWSLDGHRIEPVTLADPLPDMQVGMAWARTRPVSAPVAAVQQYFSSLS